MKPLVAILASALTCQAFRPISPVYRQPASLSDCLEAAQVTYVDGDSTRWKSAIRPYNLRVQWTPHAIAYPASVVDIQSALRCGVENGLRVTAKSGGHSYGSYGLGGEDGHLVIQLDRMHRVELREDNVAVVSAGTRLGLVALELYNQGKRAISHGTCPSVGVGGHVSHGGFGFSSHTHGLAMDAVVGISVVLANGTLLHASATENADLFWAARGAGSSIGIVTEFEFETFEAPDQVSSFSIPLRLASKDRDEVVKGMLDFQDIIEGGGMDRKLNMRLGLSASDTLEAVYHGNMEDGRTALEVFTDVLDLEWSNRTFMYTGTWLENLQEWTYGDPLNLTTQYNGSDTSYTSSLLTKRIPETAMSEFVDYWLAARTPGSFWWLQMDVHGDPNGAIGQVPHAATSYPHRDKLWLFQIAQPLKLAVDQEAAFEFVNGFADSLKNNLEAGHWGRYANYLDSQLTQTEAQEQYWMGHLERLRAIKADVDPDEVFWNPQSIQPAM